MPPFVVVDDRSQGTLFPERLEDYLSDDNRSRRSSFCDELDMAGRPCKRGSIESRLKCAFAPDRSGIHSARKIVDRRTSR
jgi:hypothetical protein